MSIIARETIFGQRPGEDRFAITVEIGTSYPYKGNPDEWVCPLTLAGLRERIHEVHGGSALQALCLVVSLACAELRAFQEDGVALSYPGGTPYDLDATFGRGLLA